MHTESVKATEQGAGKSALSLLILILILTSWTRILLGKLIVAQLSKKFPAPYGTRSSIAMFTRVCY
jgi:hypothetical protein